MAEYEYNANSQLISNSRNDITTTYDYNELGQVTQLTTSDISEQIQQFSYQYDEMGNIVEEVRTESETTNTRTYSYDGANQLTEFTDNDYTEKYSYDSVGNMLNKDVNGALTSYVYNEANQLTTETIQEKTIEYIYNQNGDLVEKSSGEQYTYDIQGNLTSIVGNGINQSFTYNGNGNRLSKTVDGETTYYVNDLNQRYEQVLQTYNDEGVIDTYTYGLQRIDSQGETNETYLYDGRGSVVGSVNADNEFVSYSYTAYGELMPNSPTPTVFGYNAEATDFTLGQQYLRARYYDTTMGRFFQEDDYRGKFSKPISMNRYAYTNNNPVMGIDPSGYISTHGMPSSVQAIEQVQKEIQKRQSVADENAAIIAKGQEYAAYYSGGYNKPTDWPEKTDVSSPSGGTYTPSGDTQDEGEYNCSEDDDDDRKWWQKVGDGIKDAADAVVDTVGTAVNTVVDVVETVQSSLNDENSTLNKVLDGVQIGLGVLGMIPVIGEVCDLVDGVISLARGDYAGAALSLMSAIPLVGNIAGVAKIGTAIAGVAGVVKVIDKVGDIAAPIIKIVDKVEDFASPIKKVVGTAVDPLKKYADEALVAMGSLFTKNSDKIIKEGLEEVAVFCKVKV